MKAKIPRKTALTVELTEEGNCCVPTGKQELEILEQRQVEEELFAESAFKSFKTLPEAAGYCFSV